MSNPNYKMILIYRETAEKLESLRRLTNRPKVQIIEEAIKLFVREYRLTVMPEKAAVPL
jgi:predicted DNA-binding protein